MNMCDVIYGQTQIILALHLKDIDYEYKAVHLVRDGGEQNKEDYKAFNFLGQVQSQLNLKILPLKTVYTLQFIAVFSFSANVCFVF